VGKKRLRVEVLLATAALPSPSPAPVAPRRCLTVLPALPEDEADPDLAAVLALLPQADVYLQDEVQIALHPTLTRVWSRRGRRGQRRVEAPGQNVKRWGFGLVDWRDGWLDWVVAPGRWAAPLVEQLRRAVARSKARDRCALVILDNLGIHTPRGSKLLRALVEEEGEHLILVYTPAYDPDSNPIEWLWRTFRPAVTHTHQRRSMEELIADADAWIAACTPQDILQHLGSPSKPTPVHPEELAHAA
jgi:hypothetical protein